MVTQPYNAPFVRLPPSETPETFFAQEKNDLLAARLRMLEHMARYGAACVSPLYLPYISLVSPRYLPYQVLPREIIEQSERDATPFLAANNQVRVRVRLGLGLGLG